MLGDFSFGLTIAGEGWTWGNNDYGQLGNNGPLADCSSPVSVVGNHSFSQICGGVPHSRALKSDGSCWAWGYNLIYGQLGINSLISRSSPVSVVGGHSFSQISGGFYFSLALKSDGSCWSCGCNDVGILGDNTVSHRSSPVSVVGNHSFSQICCGYTHSCALKSSNGSCWTWGYNYQGVLGTNSLPNRSSPVSVVGNHSFSQISGGFYFSLALKSDGSCWAWGDDLYGQLGENTFVDRSSPVSVVGGHSFSQISGGGYHSFALKSDGSCWAWGINDAGELGDNTVSYRSSPVSVVGGHSFCQIAGGKWHSLGLKSDGSLWAWGSNLNDGQIGDGTANNRSSPVSVIGGFVFNKLPAYSQSGYVPPAVPANAAFFGAEF